MRSLSDQKFDAYPAIITFLVLLLTALPSFSVSDATLNPYITKLADAKPPVITKLKGPEKVPATNPVGHFTNFDTEQGLALSNITCVYVDSKGKVWFGTHGGGVSIFDGNSFTNLTTKHGLIHNSVWAITEDSKGNFWFGTFGGGITKYDGVSFTSYTTDDGLSNNTVWTIEESDDGRIWFGTFGDGISVFDGKEFSTIGSREGLPNGVVWKIYKDSKGNMWFGTENGICKYGDNGFINYNVNDGLTHNIVRDIIEDDNGNLWIATFGGGVSMFDGHKFKSYTTKDGLPHNTLRAITKDDNGNIWVGSHGGGAAKITGEFIIKYTTDQGLSHNVIRGIAKDKKGNIWFGTDGGGASGYNGDAFKTYTTKQGLVNNSVRCIAEVNNGGLWFGTNGGGMSYYDGMHYYNYNINNGLPSNVVYTILPENNGSIWLGTDSGAVYFDGKKFTIYTEEQGLGHNRVLGIYKDSEGYIWFGTSNGLSKFNGKGFTTFRTEHGLTHNVVRSIAEDTSGNLWLGTYGGGVSQFDGNKFTSFTTEDGLTHNWVRKIFIDSEGYIWFGTYGGGINRYDGESFISFGTEEGLADDVVYDIVEDSDGTFWIGTNLGFSGLNFKNNEGEIFSPAKVKTDNNKLLSNFTPIWDIYNNETGYPVKDLNSNAMCISKIGLPQGINKEKEIIWGGCGDDKVVAFNPKAVAKNYEPSKLEIFNIKINDENISWYLLHKINNDYNKNKLAYDSVTIAQQQVFTYGNILNKKQLAEIRNKFKGIKFDSIKNYTGIPQNLILPYRHNNITFEFNSIETSRNNLVRYQYMLKGQDKRWRPLTKSNYATFNNLREGKYTFVLKARNPEGIWSESITCSFRVLPPWYRTWWMFSIYLLCIILFLLAVIKWKERKLKKEKLILEEKVKERTLELKQQKEEAEKQKALVEEKNQEITSQKEEILKQKEQLFEKRQELEKINTGLEERIKKELSESRRKDFMLIQQGRQAAMGEMIANIAHQWRQPLNAIGLIIQNLQEAYEYGEMDEEYLKAKVKQSMDIILYMSDTINDFRDFFKPERVASSFSAKKVLEKSISFVEETIKRANIIIDYNPPENDILAFGFTNEYAQVILNLISNAKDVLLERKIKDAKIKISLTTKDNKSCLTISDNGGGIDESLIDKVFDPYFSTKKEGMGTGLGLYMSKTIIEKIEGGYITCRNNEEGAEFTVVL